MLLYFGKSVFSLRWRQRALQKLKLMNADDEIPYTSPTNSAVLISPTSMISNSSAISVPSSQSAHLISPMNANNINNNQSHQMMNSSSQNGSLVPYSQSAHQLGHATIPQQPHTPLASHHQALQHQLQKHFANNNMGELSAFLCVWKHFSTQSAYPCEDYHSKVPFVIMQRKSFQGLPFKSSQNADKRKARGKWDFPKMFLLIGRKASFWFW